MEATNEPNGMERIKRDFGEDRVSEVLLTLRNMEKVAAEIPDQVKQMVNVFVKEILDDGIPNDVVAPIFFGEDYMQHSGKVIKGVFFGMDLPVDSLFVGVYKELFTKLNRPIARIEKALFECLKSRSLDSLIHTNLRDGDHFYYQLFCQFGFHLQSPKE